MKRLVMNVVMGLVVLVMFGLTGCGGGGSGSTPDPNEPTTELMTAVGWFFENVAPDLSNNGATCFLNLYLHYSETIAADEIESFVVTAPTGWSWTFTSANSELGTYDDGSPYCRGTIWYEENANAFALAGIWTAELKLKNGETSSLQFTLREPGSSADATHPFLYTREDWTPSTNPSQYVPALGRFPSTGFTLQYTAANGGRITSSGLAAVRASYLAAEPRTFNMVCWLFDANNDYLGYTDLEYSLTDHSATNLITAAGELSIVPAATKTSSATGTVDLSRVKYIRIVYFDGAQYAPESYAFMDHRSISSLIAVNQGPSLSVVPTSSVDNIIHGENQRNIGGMQLNMGFDTSIMYKRTLRADQANVR